MDLTIWPVLALLAALAAGALLLTRVVVHRRGALPAGSRRTRGSSSTPVLASACHPFAPDAGHRSGAPAAPEEDPLARHRRYAVEALDLHAGGQPLCRVGPGAPAGVKGSEGAVAALARVARRRGGHPEEGLQATVAWVRQAWTAELGSRNGEHWHAYREGGTRALEALAQDLDDAAGAGA